MFKSTRNRQLLTIILWIAILFIAIINLPSFTDLITNVNESTRIPSQISESRSLSRANEISRHWGRGLNHTSPLDLIYIRKSGPINPRQQSQINRRTNDLLKKSRQFGIQKITDLDSDRDGTNELRSKDNSTEIIRLNVRQRPHEIRRIIKHSRVPSLTSSVTSPQELKNEGLRSTVHLTLIATLTALLLSGIALGLIFKSLILPVISWVTLSITDFITLSLTGYLTRWIGINEYTPLTVSLAIILMGSLLTDLISQAVFPELPRHRDANNAVRKGIGKIKRPVEISGIVLTVSLGAAAMTPQAVIKPVADVGVALAVTTLAELTLFPTFIAWLGTDIRWPGSHYERPTDHQLWHRLAQLSLWQPLIGIIAVVYFIVPFAYSYRDNLQYQQADNLTHRNLACRGQDALNAHFTAGKSTPVIVYIQNSKPFHSEKTLKPLDDLTTKLQSIPGVNAVNSLTQPGGMPISKYYVNQQLSAVNNDLNRRQDQLVRVQQLLKSGQKKLAHRHLSNISRHLNRLQLIKDQIPTVNLPRAVGEQQNTYRNQLRVLNYKLNQLSGGLNQIPAISDDTKGDQHQIKAARNEILSVQKQVKRVNNHLNTLYAYLSRFQRSSAARQYFITPNQIQDTDFQQSLINFTNHNQRVAQLEIIFNQTPTTRYNRSRIQKLQREIKTQLQGTPLNHAKVAMKGVPVQQAVIQRNFKRGAMMVFLISFGLIVLSLILISRSILHPLFWMLSFGISTLAGLQITELISRFAAGQSQFNWQIMLTAETVLTGISTLELVPLSLSYRHRHVELIEWLHEELTSLGQNVSALLIITILTTAGLFITASTSLAQIGLIIITTTIIFNWVLPLLASAFGKYLKTLPHSRL